MTALRRANRYRDPQKSRNDQGCTAQRSNDPTDRRNTGENRREPSQHSGELLGARATLSVVADLQLELIAAEELEGLTHRIAGVWGFEHRRYHFLRQLKYLVEDLAPQKFCLVPVLGPAVDQPQGSKYPCRDGRDE